MKTQLHEYKHGDSVLEAFVAYPENTIGKTPAVVIMHAWSGRDSFVEQKARYYAERGYIGIALDNYGKGIRGKSPEENGKLMSPFMQDRKFLAERLMAGIRTAKTLPYVDSHKVIVTGYCFGGLCALDLLRNAVELTGVISIHGLLGEPTEYKPHYHTQTKVFALCGYNDPMVTPEQTAAFGVEMDKAKVEWQMISFGKTQHAFTNPEAHDKNLGLIYNPTIAKRSTVMIDNFIDDCFA